jgi:NAD(P)-dependent dehydrogenase (short-subunit alcohol dehydrogenase family)
MKLNDIKELSTVLITGASTGIGFATAIHLDALGFKVYAGVRKDKDKEKLLANAKNGLTPLMLDVCDYGSIEKAFLIIRERYKGGYFHVINNAGLSVNGPLELMDYSDIKKVIDVNLTGLLIVTKTFLPLIRNSQGRIINISSGHGLLAIPDKSVYAASKFGVQALSNSLRVELKPFGVKVCSIIVGKVNTSVLGKILDDRRRMINNANPEVFALYKTLIEYFDKEVKDIPGIEAIEVAKKIGDAIIDNNPKSQYLIGPGAKKMRVLGKFPAKMRDKMLYKAIYK